MASKIYRLTVDSQASGQRIDQYVAGQIEDLSRGVVRKVIDLGGVHLAGRRIGRCSQAVRAGQSIEVYLDGRPLDKFSLLSEHVLFQDDYLLIIDKPPGIDFQPTHARFKGTLYDATLRFIESTAAGKGKVSLGMVQRLDRDTSGVTVFSIHQRAHRAMTRMFADRRVDKRYRTLVFGHLNEKEGEFRSLLARQHRTNLMKSVKKGGKEAITRYRVVEEFAESTLVEVELITGRSHQIRAHFSEAGHPLLGDTRYGGPAHISGYEIQRSMLHAFRLSFEHPVSHENLMFEAPLPEDMAGLLVRLAN
ncbi:pseudouridine synthase [Syntrophotalea acetylenivorans]|uniref:Pseudouridine synthase n=1 Tax=Syntrophotalea acetylenivorans TaxID=1842532 RepID=A0A1L3GMI8_9BACT|nr:RluA family pseudouridine synthase [Syntrophotalea acetylenivorans]APG27110.1 pseudouridine synthase [Syntrophotalea acetylenivorans]